MSTTDNKNKFIGWAYTTQAGPRQLETIKTYANKLEDISVITGINIGMPFFDIQTPDEFQSAKSKIEGMPDYINWNREYQHGIISASLNLFQKYINAISNTSINTDDLWPTLEEYNPNITKEQWLELLNDGSLFTENAYIALAAMHDFGGQATCAQLSIQYGRTPDFYRNTMGTQLATKVLEHFNLEKCNEDGKEWVWPVLFRGRKAKKDEAGNYLWVTRPELYDALTEFGISRYLKTEKISFDSWDILDKNTAIKHCDKSFWDSNGSGIPQEICWFFGADGLKHEDTPPAVTVQYQDQTYSLRIYVGPMNRKRIFWGKDLANALADKRSLLNVTATFRKIAESTYELTVKGDEAPMTLSVKESVERIRGFIASRGFQYDEKLIENFYLSLKSKPFVILAGTSGTGKSKLVKLFAEAIYAEYFLVPVKPDWSDSSDLFGHFDLQGNFKRGPICDAFDAALARPDTPVFVCLDEMNLARVEYYLSDYLSVIETREWKDGKIVTGEIGTENHKYDTIPENLYVIGTVNMDETTFPFSKKVLDRANTIEFNKVDLTPDFSSAAGDVEPIQLDNSFLRSDYLVLTKDCAAEQEEVTSVCNKLITVNNILKKCNAHIGYRVRDEICFYMLNNKTTGLLDDEDEAFDCEILQKILPRLQGSSEALKNAMKDLFKVFVKDENNIDENGHMGETMLNRIGKHALWPESAKKIAYMMTRFEEDGFTSYWL